MRHRCIPPETRLLFVPSRYCDLFYPFVIPVCTDRTNWYPRGIHYTLWNRLDNSWRRWLSHAYDTLDCYMPSVLTIPSCSPLHLCNVSLLIYIAPPFPLKKKKKSIRSSPTSKTFFKIIISMLTTPLPPALFNNRIQYPSSSGVNLKIRVHQSDTQTRMSSSRSAFRIGSGTSSLLNDPHRDLLYRPG